MHNKRKVEMRSLLREWKNILNLTEQVICLRKNGVDYRERWEVGIILLPGVVGRLLVCTCLLILRYFCLLSLALLYKYMHLSGFTAHYLLVYMFSLEQRRHGRRVSNE